MKDTPETILGVTPEAGDEEIRAAYLRNVEEFPPDRSPREFERVRDAYEALRDPRRRRTRILDADPEAPFASLLEGMPMERRHVGPEPWLAAIRERPATSKEPK
ncbi:MAG TPA: J domain-containing protein [Thermoanaerobaculia bacterium]|jgi:curved DNA-binding protein CbpA